MGHTVRLHVYDEPKGVPADVTLVDANAIVPREKIIRHRKNGSLALFSDLYRYELMAREEGLWIDTDVLCIRPIVRTGEYVFGLETNNRINGAVLRVPANSAMLSELVGIFKEREWVPPWSDLKRKIKHRAFYKLKRDYGVGHMSWGTAGPRAISYFAAKHDVSCQAQPVEAFYPIPASAAAAMFDPEQRLQDFVRPNSFCIHLWSDMIGKILASDPPKGSIMESILNKTWRLHL